jgi:hypothetical protein
MPARSVFRIWGHTGRSLGITIVLQQVFHKPELRATHGVPLATITIACILLLGLKQVVSDHALIFLAVALIICSFFCRVRKRDSFCPT